MVTWVGVNHLLRDRVSWKELWSTVQKKLSTSCLWHGHLGGNALNTLPVHREMGTEIAMICGNSGQSQQCQQHWPETDLVQIVLRSSQLVGSLCIPGIGAVGEQEMSVHQPDLFVFVSSPTLWFWNSSCERRGYISIDCTHPSHKWLSAKILFEP